MPHGHCIARPYFRHTSTRAFQPFVFQTLGLASISFSRPIAVAAGLRRGSRLQSREEALFETVK